MATSHREGFNGFESGACAFVIGPHSQVHGQNKSPERNRFHFEMNDVQGEFVRMKGLGAKVIAEPYHMGDERDL